MLACSEKVSLVGVSGSLPSNSRKSKDAESQIQLQLRSSYPLPELKQLFDKGQTKRECSSIRRMCMWNSRRDFLNRSGRRRLVEQRSR